MKKPLLILFSLLAIFSCSDRLDNSVAEKNNSNKDIMIIANDSISDLLFKIQLPEGWQKVKEKPEAHSYLIMKENPNSNLWNNMSISAVKIPTQNYSIGYFKNRYDELYKSRKGEMKIYSEDSGFFSNCKFYRIEYNSSALNNDYRNTDIYYFKDTGSVVFTINSSFPEENIQNMKAEFEFISSSIVIK